MEPLFNKCKLPVTFKKYNTLVLFTFDTSLEMIEVISQRWSKL